MRVRAHERETPSARAVLLALVGLASHASAYAGTLSGGQRKLLDLARVLMPSLARAARRADGGRQPDATRRELLEHVLKLRRERGLTFLIVEHDLDFVMRAADRVVVMNEGTRARRRAHPTTCGQTRPSIDAYLGARLRAAATAHDRRHAEVRELEAGYDDALILDGVSLEVAAGRSSPIVGPNGAGKSTLLKAVYGLLRPRAGAVFFAGDDVTGAARPTG